MVPFAYYEDMRRSVFCLCPLGWAPWSPRIVESLQQGCIPVIISDNIILPFREFVDWPAITVHVPEKDVPRLDEILSAIPVEEVSSQCKCAPGLPLCCAASVMTTVVFRLPSSFCYLHRVLAALHLSETCWGKTFVRFAVAFCCMPHYRSHVLSSSYSLVAKA